LDHRQLIEHVRIGAAAPTLRDIYQNFIALIKWAHPLQPDAIISFSGHNEIAVPWMSKSDADQLTFLDSGLLQVLRYSASPRWLSRRSGPSVQ
jgi:hypothetical protein